MHITLDEVEGDALGDVEGDARGDYNIIFLGPNSTYLDLFVSNFLKCVFCPARGPDNLFLPIDCN